MINKKIMPALTSLLLSCSLVSHCYAGEDDVNTNAEETIEQSDNAKEQLQRIEYEMIIVGGGGDDGLKPPQ